MKDLNAMVIRIRHVNVISAADNDGVRQPKLAGSRPGFAPVHEQPALLVKNLHVVENRVPHIDMAGAINGNATATTMSATIPLRTPMGWVA